MYARVSIGAALLLLSACTRGNETRSDGAVPVLESARGARVYELRKPVMGDGAPIASDNYFCSVCATDPAAGAAFDATAFGSEWIVAPRRTLEVDEAFLFEPLNSREAPVIMDLIDSIAGAEFRLGAQPLFGQIVGGLGVIVTMESSRRLTWHVGASVEEIQGDGETYVLFDKVVEPGVEPPASIPLPPGWTHTSRVLDAPFVLSEVPRVVVFMHLTYQHLWQRITPPP